MAVLSPFLFAQIEEKKLSVRMNTSNTNEHFFLILYTCINYNAHMNPMKFRLDQIHNGWFIPIFVCSNWQNIKKIVRPDKNRQHQWIFFSDTIHMHYLQSSHESCEVSSGSIVKWLIYPHFCLLKLTKYSKNCPSR